MSRVAARDRLAKTLPRRELEKEVARVNPKSLKKESARFVNEHTLELNVTVSEETFKLLERVKELMAQKSQNSVSPEDALKTLAEGYVTKHDPVKKAERVLLKKKNTIPAPRYSPGNIKNRNSIKANLRHQIYLRDKGACQFKDSTGSICNQKQWIDLHHIKPKSQGGLDSLENLTTLCKSHHTLTHERMN